MHSDILTAPPTCNSRPVEGGLRMVPTLLPRMRSAHLEILKFAMGGAY